MSTPRRQAGYLEQNSKIDTARQASAFASEVDLFSFIGPLHPFYPYIQNFKMQLVATPLYRKVRQRIDNGEKVQVRVSMRARLLPDFVWKFKGFYVSFQLKDRGRRLPFQALTFFYSAKTNSIEAYEFPKDPYLTALASYFDGVKFGQVGDESAFGLDVLRYIPRWRLTFRAPAGYETAESVIGKFVRRSKIEETYSKQIKVSRAVVQSPSTFSVAAPVGIDGANGLFLQEAKPGQELATLISEDNFSDLLYLAGTIHRELHSLNIQGLPQADFESFLENLTMQIEWISLFRPEQTRFLNGVRELLLKHAPRVDPAEYSFCHGDFSCFQIMIDSKKCAVIDFDDCMRGDPYLEIARLMAFLKYDVSIFKDHFMNPKQYEPGLLEAAYESYLSGYEATACQALNRKRLLWYRICCEVYYLTRLFKRDLFHPIAFERTVSVVRDLCERFQKENGEEL